MRNDELYEAIDITDETMFTVIMDRCGGVFKPGEELSVGAFRGYILFKLLNDGDISDEFEHLSNCEPKEIVSYVVKCLHVDIQISKTQPYLSKNDLETIDTVDFSATANNIIVNMIDGMVAYDPSGLDVIDFNNATITESNGRYILTV